MNLDEVDKIGVVRDPDDPDSPAEGRRVLLDRGLAGQSLALRDGVVELCGLEGPRQEGVGQEVGPHQDGGAHALGRAVGHHDHGVRVVHGGQDEPREEGGLESLPSHELLGAEHEGRRAPVVLGGVREGGAEGRRAREGGL